MAPGAAGGGAVKVAKLVAALLACPLDADVNVRVWLARRNCAHAPGAHGPAEHIEEFDPGLVVISGTERDDAGP